MTDTWPVSTLKADIFRRALDARDPRFDGVFFVGITSTGVYCRPVCPARISHPERRRFFESSAAAERAGFRPCLRCRPELAPGRALIDAVPRLARIATHRIAAGALNGHSVAELARELSVSERHLRRALEREIGVSPLELALTHRLLLAKQLLSDTDLAVTRIAFASGFQSLRRFNAVFLERYGMPPSAMRYARKHAPPHGYGGAQRSLGLADADFVALTASYRPPLAWDVLVDQLARESLPGVDLVTRGWYARSVEIKGNRGTVIVENDSEMGACAPPKAHLNVSVSPSLLSVLMSVLARVRQLFDLDAEPTVVDTHLAQEGLEAFVRRHPGLRSPGAFGAFDAVLRILLGEPDEERAGIAARLVREFGTPMASAIPEITHSSPSPARLAEVSESRLVSMGMKCDRARVLVAIARALQSGALRLEPGEDVEATRRTLLPIVGMDERIASMILMRTLHWPDVLPFPESDLSCLSRAAGGSENFALTSHRWRPWLAYAAVHLQRRAAELAVASGGARVSA